MKSDKKYIVHVVLEGEDTQVPVFAKSLDDAAEWAERTYESQGIQINRIREAR